MVSDGIAFWVFMILIDFEFCLGFQGLRNEHPRIYFDIGKKAKCFFN